MTPIWQDICTQLALVFLTRCSECSIADNQHVVEGQTLVILDPNDYKVRLDEAQAALDAASQQVETADAAIRSTSQSATAQTTQAQGAIAEANASIQASKAAVIAAEAGVPRAEAQLQQANATSEREEVDRADTKISIQKSRFRNRPSITNAPAMRSQ